jgi:hypothetical protein
MDLHASINVIRPEHDKISYLRWKVSKSEGSIIKDIVSMGKIKRMKAERKEEKRKEAKSFSRQQKWRSLNSTQ